MSKRTAAKFAVLALIFSLVHRGNGSVLDVVFNSTYTKLVLENPAVSESLLDQCIASNVTYSRKILINETSQVYRVPHSGIVVDGKSCGSLPSNASDDELFLDNYMLLVPGRLFISNVTASENGVTSLYRAMFIDKFRAHARHAFESLMNLNDDVWVGYEEQSDRVCDGKQIFSRQTIILFAKCPSTKGIDFSFEVNGVNENSTQVLSFSYGINFDIHLSLSEYALSEQRRDRICPFRTVPDTDNAGKKSGCFPAKSMVHVRDLGPVEISSVLVGNSLLDANGKYSEVFMFTHADNSSERHLFVRLLTENGSVLTASPGHFVYTAEGLAVVDSIVPGSLLQRGDGSFAQVLSKTYAELPGLFNPQTLSGSLVVDGFLVSAYTNAVSPSVAHAALTPLRAFHRRFGIPNTISRYICWLSHCIANSINSGSFRQAPKQQIVSSPELIRESGRALVNWIYMSS